MFVFCVVQWFLEVRVGRKGAASNTFRGLFSAFFGARARGLRMLRFILSMPWSLSRTRAVELNRERNRWRLRAPLHVAKKWLLFSFFFLQALESDSFLSSGRIFVQDSAISGADGSGIGMADGGAPGGYRHGVFVRAARGSSIDVGLFHDDQRRSVATLEVWVNAGEKV